MSLSTRILLFAAVSIGVTCIMGTALLVGTQLGRTIREEVIDSQNGINSLDRVEDSVWTYLEALSRARRSGQESTSIRRAQEAFLDQEWALLQRLTRGEAGTRQEEQPFAHRHAELEEIFQGMRAWDARAEARVLQEPQGVAIASLVEHELYEDYARTAGERIVALKEEEGKALERRRALWNVTAQRSMVLGGTATVCGALLLAVFTLGILLPLRGSLRTLRISAERIGHGDFDVVLPSMGRGELGLLARTLERMAGELKASMRQLQSTQEQLHFSERLAAVGRLAAGISHEINNPLAYIISNLRFIRTELSGLANPSPSHQELMDAITEANEGAERVRLIVQDLKMLSRPDDLALGPVDLGTVVRGTTKIVAQELRGRARLVEECDGVPLVWGNGPRLSQVLLNLLINAAHAIEPGRAEHNEVRVVARKGEPGHILVEVSDTGCGIPAENLSRIFEPFFTTKPIGVGTGLGLSVCQSVVSSLGGSLVVESQVGRGTTFRIQLRIAPAERVA